MSKQEILGDKFFPNAQALDVAEVKIQRNPVLENFGERFVGFGSCFAGNMRQHLESFGFHFFFTSEISAHYNTETLANILDLLASGREPDGSDLYTVADGDVFLYRCHFKHRFFGDDAAERALARMRELVGLLRSALEKTDFVLITLGTSRVVRLKANRQAVAAVIQVDREHWTFDSLSVSDNVANMRRIFRSLAIIRGGRPLKVFLTVSPQRYLFGQLLEPGNPSDGGDAVVDNFLSKAQLRVAVDQIVREGWENMDVRYFPAFEIVYEELRQFESLAHYDLCHIDQIHTPQRVVKKFLQAYASDAVLAQILAITEVRGDLREMGRLISGGMAADAPEIQRRVDAMLAQLGRFGEELTPPGIGLMYHLIQNYRPGQSIRDLRFRHLGFGNRLALARSAASEGDRALAMRIANELIDELGARRTQDPDAGKEIEHRVHDEAVEFLRRIG